VRLDRCYEQGVSFSRQLALLEAADQATALTIHIDQVEQLLQLLAPQPQQRLSGAELEQEQPLGVQNEDMMEVDRAVPHSAATAADNSNSSHSRAAVEVPGAPQTATWAPTAHRRGLTHLTITGQPTTANLQQLEQLLDVLPGTQHLQQIVLSSEPADTMYWGRDVTWTSQGVVWPEGADAAAAEQQDEDAPTTPTHTTAAAADSSSGGAHVAPPRDAALCAHSRGCGTTWRSSCHTLLAGRGCSSKGLAASELVPFLGSLEQLQVLYLHEVQAAYMWEDPCLKQLRALHVDWAHMRSFYETQDVARLTGLRHLDFNHCNRGLGLYLDDAFLALANLTSLDLRHTRIGSHGLEVVCNMSSLRRLDLTHSISSQALTNSISRLTNLQSLVVSRCPLQQLPDGISCLDRLESLVLDGCLLEQLPDSISHLGRLQVLQLNGCPLEQLADSISHLVSLQALQLYDTKMDSLPEGLTALTGLRHLEWSKTRQGRYECLDYGVVRRLISLQHLAIRDNFGWPPYHIKELTALTKLWLDACEMDRSHVRDLLHCEQLQRLTLLAPRVGVLPRGITALNQLTYIQTYSCTKMPPGLSPAVQVETQEYVADDEEDWRIAPGGDSSDDTDDEDFVV
jgi:hypothetical protein